MLAQPRAGCPSPSPRCKKFHLDRSPPRGAFDMADPRLYQIGVLASLLVYGMTRLEFGITVPRACLLLLTALATQAICDWMTSSRSPLGQVVVNSQSALISALS